MRNVVKTIFAAFLIGILVVPTAAPHALTSEEIQKQIDELNQQLDGNQSKIKELERKSTIYETNIKLKRQEAKTLANELEIIDSTITIKETEIEKAEIELDTLNAQIDQIESLLRKLELDLRQSQADITHVLRGLQIEEHRNALMLFLQNKDWSEALNVRYRKQQLSNQLTKKITLINQNQSSYNDLSARLTSKKADIFDVSDELTFQSEELRSQNIYKQNLLQKTQQQESRYQTLLANARTEYQQQEAEIQSLERTIRKKLEQKQQAIQDEKKREEEKKRLEQIQKKSEPATDGGTILAWPVPSRRITATFHDPTYPFRHLFEHSGIDLGSTPNGTECRAAGAGYVARAKDAGMGYSYIMIIHGNDISTVYGHMSKIYVQQGSYVAKGQLIGLTGGMPGTPGAGSYSTGPHLHFEVRKNGIPVNPLNYLP